MKPDSWISPASSAAAAADLSVMKRQTTAIEVGVLLAAPVVLVALGDDVLPALVLDEAEGTGADRGVVVLVLQRIGIGVEVLGDRVAEIGHGREQELERHRFGVAEHRRVVVRAVDRLEVPLQRRAVVQVLLPQLHRRVGDVVAGERLAVVPAHPLAQLEGDLPPVLARGPGGREHRLVALVGLVDQGLHDLARDVVDAGRGAQRGVEDALLGGHVHDDGAAALGLGVLGGGDAGQEGERDGQEKRRRGARWRAERGVVRPRSGWARSGRSRRRLGSEGHASISRIGADDGTVPETLPPFHRR